MTRSRAQLVLATVCAASCSAAEIEGTVSNDPMAFPRFKDGGPRDLEPLAIDTVDGRAILILVPDRPACAGRVRFKGRWQTFEVLVGSPREGKTEGHDFFVAEASVCL